MVLKIIAAVVLGVAALGLGVVAVGLGFTAAIEQDQEVSGRYVGLGFVCGFIAGVCLLVLLQLAFP